MASATTVGSALSRLSAHFRIERTEEETEVVLRDWVRAFGDFDDEIIRTAVDVWVLSEDRFPPLSRLLDTVQNEARLLLRARSEARALPQGPKNDEPLADGKAYAEIVRLSNGFEFVDPSRRPKRTQEVRPHDHERGEENCPICIRALEDRLRDERDRDLDPEPLWSPCSECDGSRFVEVEDGTPGLSVRPCRVCNGRNYDLWSGGHFRLNHRCDECAPSSRRKMD